jgi:methionyl-tRNA formyltransferase
MPATSAGMTSTNKQHRARQEAEMPLRLIFMGTPEFSVPTLRALAAHGHQIVAVYTRPAMAAKRGLKPQATPVELEARERGIPVYTPATFKTPEAVQRFSSHFAHAAVVVAYGQLLPKEVLDAPTYGCFNLHGSLLPRWRGAAPIERAIIEGDTRTGVMVMKMDVGLDTGDIALTAFTDITDQTTSGDLRRTLAQTGAELMVQAMDDLEHGRLHFRTQNAEGTYAAKIDKAAARIDWGLPANKVLRHIHGYSPSPGAWCEIPVRGQLARVRILRCELVLGWRGSPGELLDDRLTVACGQDAIRILELQPPGKNPMSAGAFLAGARITRPQRLY